MKISSFDPPKIINLFLILKYNPSGCENKIKIFYKFLSFFKNVITLVPPITSTQLANEIRRIDIQRDSEIKKQKDRETKRQKDSKTKDKGT